MADLNLKAGTNMSIRQEDTDLYLDNTYEYDDTQIQQDILTRSLITETGKTIELTLNNTNYKMTAILKNKYGNVISTSNEIDLPIESLVVSIYYDSTTKELVFVLKDGTTTRVPLLDLIDGLATEEDLQTLEDNVNNTIQTFEDDINEDMETFKGDVEQELEKAQQELNQYKMLENALPKVEGEGESIHVEDTAKCPMKMGFKGQIQQDSTTGKNKLNCAIIYQTTRNGMTLTYDNKTQELTFNGTCTQDNTAFGFDTIFEAIQNISTLTCYWESGTLINFGSLRFYNETYGGNMSINLSLLNLNNPIMSITSSQSQQLVHNYIRFNNGSVADNFKIKIMYADSTDTTYEPYTGGSPSPSPSYPQDIHIVSGDNEIKVYNKNLFDKDNTQWDRNNSSSYNIDTGGTKTDRIRTSSFAIKGGETYTISGIPTGISLVSIRTYEIPSGNSIGSVTASNGTFTLNSNIKYIHLLFGGSNFTDDTKTLMANANIQLEKGSTSSEYEAYTEQSQLISLGVENLFDGELELGSYWGTDGTKMSANDNYRNANIIKVQPNTTYTLSINGVSQKYVLFTYKEDKTFIQEITSYTTGTFTTGNNVGYINFRCFAADFTSDFANLKVQLEKGSKANSYSEYGTTPIEVGGIGDYEDEFFKNVIDSEYYDSTLLQDKWYLKKRIGKVVLDGSESWTLGTKSSIGLTYFYSNIYDSLITDKTYLMYSNYFSQPSQKIKPSYISTKPVISGTDTAGEIIRLRVLITSGVASDKTTFESWLGTNKPIVYYVLATPENILLNDTLQETLDSFYSYQEQTNISQENNDLPFVIKASAIYDLSNLVTRVAVLESEG